MSEDRSYLDNYIGLNDYRVHFNDEVSEYFSSKLGKEEFMEICKKSCQAPPYTSVRINLLEKTREEALKVVTDLLVPFNETLQKEGRDVVTPYLHDSIQELIIIPSAKSVCPSVEELKKLPIAVMDRMCAESVLRGSDIFVKGLRALEKGCIEGTKVCLAVDLCNTELPRGTSVDQFKGQNLIIGEGILRMNRTDVFSKESGLCIDQIHRISFDLPPLQNLPRFLLMQNFPSLITSLVLNPTPGSTLLDCCAAPGNKWSHLAMIMQDRGIVMGMDRSRKKAVDNLLQIKQQFGFESLHIRYVDMTKGVMSLEEEQRLKEEGEHYQLPNAETAVEVTSSKSFQKKMKRILRQKERKASEKRAKRENETPNETPVDEENETPDETPSFTLEQIQAASLLRFQNSKKNLKNEEKNKMELSILQETFPPNSPLPLQNLLSAGIRSGTARIPGFPREQFDFILLDPPCSALGLRPRLSHSVSLCELYGYRAYQRQFIEVAVQLLRVGGLLVFSTCTYDPLENEENVAFVVEKFPMELVSVREELRFGREGLDGCGLDEEKRRMVQRFNMTEECDSIGFFISKFRKVASVQM